MDHQALEAYSLWDISRWRLIMNEIVLDLGEYGDIVVVADSQKGFSEAGIQDVLRVSLEKVLQKPLVGIGKAMTAGLTDDGDGPFSLDEFNLEFYLGLQVEYGAEVGVVAKIIPSGNFKCTYTWVRRS
jgi:hypothetical protein